MEPSHRTSTPHRHPPLRTHTWPLASSTVIKPVQLPALDKTKTFEEDLDQYPGAHFLSSEAMYNDDEYDGWSSDSDSDADEVQWESGITDFALFDSDRRRAKATGQALPDKWNGLLHSQASALGRSVERSRSQPRLSDLSNSWKDEAVPDLTPDVSPHLADDLDVKSYQGQTAARPIVPSYLRSKSDDASSYSSPPESESALVDDELTLAFFPPAEHRRSRQHLVPQRPGLTGSRTLSGKLHVWRRPSLDSYSVQEDANAERTAELAQSSDAASPVSILR